VSEQTPDIVQRLRAAGVLHPIRLEAADEIERLRADAARYRWLRRFDHFALVDSLLDTTEHNTLDSAVDFAMANERTP
jgi:hypothetical protein